MSRPTRRFWVILGVLAVVGLIWIVDQNTVTTTVWWVTAVAALIYCSRVPLMTGDIRLQRDDEPS